MRTKERTNSRRGIYKLTDNFFRFWYAFAFTNYSELEIGDVEGVYQYEVAPLLHEYASFTFEDICLQYVQELQRANALPFRYTKIGRWFGKSTVRNPAQENGVLMAETEIDILAVSREMKKYFVGECKFKGRPFRYTEYLDMAAKLMPQKENAEFYYGLFSESGFDEKIMEAVKEDGRIWVYSLEEIVEGKKGR